MDEFYDGTPTTAYRGVSGAAKETGGKRRRAHSRTRRKPKETVTVKRFDVFEGERIIAEDADMVTYYREPVAWWLGE